MPQQQESNPENHNFLIRQIANGLSTTTELIQSLSTEIRDNSIELDTIKADLTNVTEDVRGLSKTLREGNGAAPVLSRIAVLEMASKNTEDSLIAVGKGLSGLKASVTSLDKKITQLSATKKIEASFMEELKKEKHSKKSRRQATIAIITSILALISAILVAILA